MSGPSTAAAGIVVRARCGPEEVVLARLRHGQDPEDLLIRLGWRVERPLRAIRLGADVLVEFSVRAAASCSPPTPWRELGPAAGATDVEKVDVVRRQRVSAAVLVVADLLQGIGPGGRSVLAARYSGTVVRWEGSWGLPGGGLDPGEEPAEAAAREAFEETGQDVQVGELAFVQSAHWVGRSPTGVLEDFHAVRLVYRGSCLRPVRPVVHDLGGTTAEAAWVELSRAGQLDWAPGPREQLTVLGVLPAQT
ncbi:NUDIX domain-containing protein [Austwickia chelonae]|uniref:NUDIX domain-containing protein n=1 Tax=Austwickia chelonae TaxID=100225 RepID=UPI0002EC203A|nr:NUDIX domain-containing protein [Austwickia chelonae]